MKILGLLAQSYYCIVVMIVATVAALAVSMKYYGRHKNLRIFTYYIAFSLLQDAIGLCSAFLPDIRSATLIDATSVNVFALFEFIIFHLFILQYILSPIRRWIIKINAFAFLLLLTFIFIKTYPRGVYVPYVTVEYIFLVLPCLLHVYELFQGSNLRPLKNQPAFWIVTGFLFHSACTVPFIATVGYMEKYQQAASSVIYIFFGLMFLFIIRANLCHPENNAAGAN